MIKIKRSNSKIYSNCKLILLAITVAFIFVIILSLSVSAISYERYSKDISLPYVLNGSSEVLDFFVYGDLADYLSRVPRTIDYKYNETPSRVEFKLVEVNEPYSKELMMPLVEKIQSLTENEEDRVRIAISIVQNIPYRTVDKEVPFAGSKVNYSLYPYEVLYYNQGICGEKSALLAFLLREMGYNVSILYFQEENHEVVGIACPIKKSFNKTGYCFVETSGPAIITDSYMEYSNGIKLKSQPEILSISDGMSLPEEMPEYKDSKTLRNIRNRNLFGLFSFWKLDDIREKYGLDGEYNLL